MLESQDALIGQDVERESVARSLCTGIRIMDRGLRVAAIWIV